MTQHPWENMYQELCGDLEQCLARLHTLWEEVGHDEHSQELRRNTVKNHVQRLLKEMVVEETDMKQSLISKIETLMVESGTLGEELSVSIKCDGFENLPLADIERGLRLKLEDYRKLKITRMEKMTQQKLKVI
uniref:Uncharacterized protein n=2 Tax=Timema TaxID=61471 RepID=A0A7R9IN75_9NEOP|nr:unnamed protein product [Timema tahoe]